MIQDDVPGFVSKYAFNLEKKLIKDVDYVITVSEPIKDYLGQLTNAPVKVLLNCKELFLDCYAKPNNEKFTVCYFGTFRNNRMFPDVIDLFGEMKDTLFYIAGRKGDLYNEVEFRSTFYDNIAFLGTISMEDVINYTLMSDAVYCMSSPFKYHSRIGNQCRT